MRSTGSLGDNQQGQPLKTKVHLPSTLRAKVKEIATSTLDQTAFLGEQAPGSTVQGSLIMALHPPSTLQNEVFASIVDQTAVLGEEATGSTNQGNFLVRLVSLP
eukprot:scaffold266859_cov36-Tisochrysis_lutea.AAC.1